MTKDIIWKFRKIFEPVKAMASTIMLLLLFCVSSQAKDNSSDAANGDSWRIFPEKYQFIQFPPDLNTASGQSLKGDFIWRWKPRNGSRNLLMIEFDFGKNVRLDKIKLLSRARRKYSIPMVGLLSRKDSEKTCMYRELTVRKWYFDARGVQEMEIDTKNVSARYIRLDIYPKYWQKWTILSGLEFWGKAAATKVASPQVLQPQYPVLDKYGQYIYEDWPGKIKSDDMLRKLGEKDMEWAENFKFNAKSLDKYGGWKGTGAKLGLKTTGFFRVEKINGKWWFVDPIGNLFFSIGMDTVWFGGPVTNIKNKKLFSWLPPARHPARAWKKSGFRFYEVNIIRKFGSDYRDKFKKLAFARLRSWGFNTRGKFSHSDAERPMPYVVMLSPKAKPIPGVRFPDPFDKNFLRAVDNCVKRYAARFKDNPWVIGYNILHEPDVGKNLYRKVLPLDSHKSPVKKELVAWIKKYYGDDVTAFNKACKGKFKSFDELLLPVKKLALTPEVRDGFSGHLVESCYKPILAAVRKYDPNHLFMGSALSSWQWTDATAKAYGKYVDVFSLDKYTNEFPRDYLKHFHDLTGKPLLIFEFGLELAGKGYKPRVSYVESGKMRGEYFQAYMRDATRCPFLLGLHYYMYMNHTVVGNSFSYGFVDITDQPDEYLVDAAKNSNMKFYKERVESTIHNANGK